MGNMDKLVAGGLSVVLVFVLAFAITSIGFPSYTDLASVDTQSEWEAGTLTDVEAPNGTLQLVGTNTSGTYTSQDFTYDENISQARVWVDAENTANATVTVTSYDGTDTQLAQVSQTIEDYKTVNLDDLANQTSGDHYTVEIQLQRTDTSDSVTVDRYAVQEEGESFLTGITAILLVIAGIGYAVRQM